MRTHRTAALATALLASLSVAACSGGADSADAVPTAEAQLVEETGPVEEETAEVADELAPELPPLPEATPAAGATVSDGLISLTVPESYVPEEPWDETVAHAFLGGVIPESERTTDTGSEASSASLSVRVPTTSWDPQPTSGVGETTSVRYGFTVEGADEVVVDWVSQDEGVEIEAEGVGPMWFGPTGYADVYVRVGDQTSHISMQTSPGDAGLAHVASIARSITVD